MRAFEEAGAPWVAIRTNFAARPEITSDIAASGGAGGATQLSRAQRIRRPFLRLSSGHRGRSYPSPPKYLRVSQAIKRKVS